MKLNIALSLPNDVRAADIALSENLAKHHETYFMLGEKENYPHITVYAVEFPDNAVEEVLDAVRKIAAQFQPIPCTVKQVEAHQGYVGVEIEKSPALAHLHEEIVAPLAPLRAPTADSSADYAMSFTPEQRDNIQRYGYADAMQLYNPHFTITRLKDEKEAGEVAKGITWDIPEFTVDSLGVYTMGDHGTCNELLQEFAFF